MTSVPLIAVGVVGSGAGGQRSRRGELLNALLPEILKAGREVGCDVVLVTYGQVMYTAAQRARKAMPVTSGVWADLPVSLRRTADDLGA